MVVPRAVDSRRPFSASALGSRVKKKETATREFESIQCMPVKYQIDKANRIIRTKCIGPVTIEEVVEHFRALERDPDCPNHVDVLLDLSEETSVPKKENLQEVASEIRRIRGRVRFGTCAIVATTDALFGMLRMFEVFTEKYSANHASFGRQERLRSGSLHSIQPPRQQDRL